ncbi:methyltransferase family protein [Methylophaga lonarensis MPL]|uniref:Methyltransferase family protein n=1 Tax=Methylophaga lonarensis MPL TaxID=1286106 RepID=M7PDL5_9GAMM|nr:class I SAM-dependent methyltransferase [Methylophaga lonarensis]EMR11990.1 methyltransferase family protein [Methylophaga lonarensis MPL]
MDKPQQSPNDMKIVESWSKNVTQWTLAVRGQHIESRRLVTNRAIIEAILEQSPRSVLDIGCGEGWLLRELASQVPELLGVDAVSSLIDAAKAADGGDFIVATFDELANALNKRQFDVAVCNFSLLGQVSVEHLFVAIPSVLNPAGVLIVQTLHPQVACGDLAYVDGWREGSWDGFDSSFVEPAPWYFRTLESWLALFSNNGLRLLEMREPVHPKTQKPASIIFIGIKDATE